MGPILGSMALECPNGMVKILPTDTSYGSKQMDPDLPTICAKLIKDKMTWHQAKATCVSHGGKLAEVISPYKSQQLLSLTTGLDGNLYVPESHKN